MTMQSSDIAAAVGNQGWSVTIFPPNIRIGGHHMRVEVSRGEIVKTRTLDMRAVAEAKDPDAVIAQAIREMTG